MKRTWFKVNRAVMGVAALAGLALPAALPARAATSNGSYAHPTWYAKYQVVSAPGFKPTATGKTQSVTVGTNLDISNEPGPQSETSIAINPTNTKQIVAGSNEINRLPMRGYYSSDGGKSYQAVDLPLPPPRVQNGFDFGSDPGVAWDARGNVYYSYIVVFFSTGGSINGTEMAVARSSDGGASWTPTYFNLETGTALFNDKPMIAVDGNSGTIYVAWDNNGGKSSSGNNLLVSHSTDGGVTFSAPVIASGTSGGPKGVIGADPFVGPDGTLYVAWNDYLNSRMAESASTDGGNTFGPVNTISTDQAGFDIGLPAQNVRRALVYPACGADTSTGANRGTLYCSWLDTTASSGADIFVSRSPNGGTTWSAPVRANTDPTGVANDQFNQWLAVDPADGSLNLSWYDTRNDPTHVSTDVYYGRSTDAGATFSNVKVTSAMTNETCCGAELNDQYGDYEGIAALNGTVRPVWTDRRAAVSSLDEEVFTATLTVH